MSTLILDPSAFIIHVSYFLGIPAIYADNTN